MSREIDALISDHIFGIKCSWVTIEGVTFLQANRNTVPFYSTDIAAAWQVMGKMQEFAPDVCALILDGGSYVIGEGSAFEFDVYAEADTAPMAICLAALKATGIKPADKGEG